MDTLYIVVPAYNEETNIETVARSWHKIAETVGGSSRLVVIDDGSKDATSRILSSLQHELPLLVPLTKHNSGHGSTLCYGYQYALNHGADYIFQTDSDGQTRPEEFWGFWDARHRYDYQIGYRKHRKDGLHRVIVTKVLKLVLFVFFCVDHRCQCSISADERRHLASAFKRCPA